MGLLGIQCKTAPASADAPSSSGSGTGHSQSAMPPSNDATTPSQPAPSSFTPVDLPDQQLPTITPVNNRESSETVAPHDFVGYSLPTFRGADENGGSAVLGATDQAPLQSSSEGWKMFGIAWYWWVIAIAAIVMLGRLVTKRFRARRHASHLTQHS